MKKIENLDEKIARAYGQNGRLSATDIAKELNVSSATVRRRTRQLLKDEKMNFVAVVDPSEFGQKVNVVIAISVEIKEMESVNKTLSQIPEVKWISLTTGRFDILLGARFLSEDDLSDFLSEKLANVKGVVSTETYVILKMLKQSMLPLT